MLRWEQRGNHTYAGYLSDFEYSVLRISWGTNHKNTQESGYCVRTENLPFSIDEVYYESLKEAKDYAETVIKKFIEEVSAILREELIKNEEGN